MRYIGLAIAVAGVILSLAAGSAAEVRGVPSSTSDPMTAIQRIYLTGGGFTEATIGTFIYHPEHNHWHFDYFATFELVGSGGNIVASNDKVSFCLLDARRIKP